VDHGGKLARQHRRLLADRAAGVEAGKLERIFDSELGQDRFFGEIVDSENDPFEVTAEALGHARDRGLGEPLDLGRVGCKSLTLAGHRRDIEGKRGERQ
jgi:hypothetical protein